MNILEELRTKFNCDVDTLAEVANVCPATIYRWQSTGDIPRLQLPLFKKFKEELLEMSRPEPEPAPVVKTTKGTPITFEQLERCLRNVELRTGPPQLKQLVDALISELRFERGVAVEVVCDRRGA